jgi:hypothetical protein
MTSVPDIMEDEPWYANTAYNFSQGKWFINTNVGHYGGDFFVFYTFLLGIGIKLFGCSLFVSRMVSVIGGLITLWGLKSILTILKTSIRTNIFVLSIFIFSNVTYVVFRTTRPDSWIIAFGIWSIFYLVKYHESKKARNIIYAALFSSLAFLVHPNGVLFGINLGVYFLINAIRERKIKHLIYFGIISLIIIMLYFFIIFSIPGFSFKNFIIQVSSRNSLSNSDYSIRDNIINFFTIYTLGIKRLYILIFELCILLLGLYLSTKGSLLRYFSAFGLINLILSILLFSPYDYRHFGEIITFSFLSFALIIENSKQKKVQMFLIAFGLVYLINNLAGDLYIIYKKYHNTPYSEIENKLSGIIPDNSTVITSLHYWYPLKSMQFYCEYTFWETKPYKDLDDLLQSNSIDYVIFTDAFFNEKTGTSGRKEDIPASIKIFYHNVVQFAQDYGQLTYSIPTVGFDTIKVYKIYAPNERLSPNNGLH